MNTLIKSTAAAGLLALTLAACGGGADDKAAQNIEAAAENQAAMMEAQADNSSNSVVADQLERRADQVEDEGERQADAVDDNDGPTTNTGGVAPGAATNRVESNVSGM